jgi:hypothetical protein
VDGHKGPYYGSGNAARQVHLPLWKFLYLVDRGILPDASFRVSGRRLFTAQDVQKITAILANRTARG